MPREPDPGGETPSSPAGAAPTAPGGGGGDAAAGPFPAAASSLSAPPRADAALDPVDWSRADRVARRLHDELAGLVACFPETARHASGMARHLGIDRTTCQRTVFVVDRPCTGPGMLERLPGVRGLRQLVEAARSSEPAPPTPVLDAVTTALDQYQELVVTLGGSRTRLTRRIALGAATAAARGSSSDAPAAPPDGGLAARTALFDAARELTGRASECWVAVYVYRPAPDDPDRVEVVRANGLVGHVARPDAVPLVVHNFSSASTDGPRDDAHEAEPVRADSERFASLANAPVEGRSPTVVLEDFTSDPPPLVTARQPHEFLVQSIDERPANAGRAVDLMLATRTLFPHPAKQAPRIEEVWALVNFPSRHLLFDVYLHPALARGCLASLDAHLWGPDFDEHVGDRWQTRLADAPPLQLLGTGLRDAPTAGYPRMHELTAQLFERAGLDPAGYVGYRCDVPYPMWRGGYCVSFDFRQPAE